MMMQELFSELGDLKRYSINYDRSGRSKVQMLSYGLLPVSYIHLISGSLTFVVPCTSQGTAEVLFARRSDAVAAVKKYNNVQLDGKPMKIELVGTNTPTAAAALPVSNGGHARNAARRYISHLLIHPESISSVGACLAVFEMTKVIMF
jgi:THO complex subunit 4